MSATDLASVVIPHGGSDRLSRPNHDIASGGWRTLNLTLPPFNFPAPERVITEKCTEGGHAFGDKNLGVWRLDTLSP